MRPLRVHNEYEEKRTERSYSSFVCLLFCFLFCVVCVVCVVFLCWSALRNAEVSSGMNVECVVGTS